MGRPQLLYDGLWRCLCPAFSRRALSEAIQAPIPARAITRQTTRHATCPRWTQRRQFGNDAKPMASTTVQPNIQATSKRGIDLSKALDEVLLAPTPPTDNTLNDISTDDLIMAVKKIRDPRGFSVHGQEIDRHQRIIQIVQHLVQSRGQPLDYFVYESMMDAMADPQGSAEGVRALFKDLAKQGLAPTATICHSALVALAVHPDYALRQQVIETMQEYWFTVDKTADQNIVVGLLRDGQYEMAYDKLMDFIDEEGRLVDLWVYDIFIVVLGHEGFLDEMLQVLLLRKQAKGSDNILLGLTHFVLDVCSSASHYQGTVFAWNTAVRNGRLDPSDGILDNVLTTAASEGDPSLASEAHSMISGRHRVWVHHYEALTEAFVKDNNVRGALRILRIMESSGIGVTEENTRALYEAMCLNKTLIDEAETSLRDLAKDGPVPLGAAAVVLEAKAKIQGSEAALDLYNDVDRLCDQSPSETMIQDILINSKNFNTIRDFLQEYKDKVNLLGQRPSRLPMAYNRLITVCLDFNELDMALRFAQHSLHHRMSKTLHPPWLRLLAERAGAKEDSRIWDIHDQFKKAGNQNAAQTIQKVLRVMRMAKKAKDQRRAAATAAA